MHDDTLDILLKTRHTPDAPTNLSTRIIDAATQPPAPAPARYTIGDTIRSFFDRFAMPQPAFALALGAVVILTASVLTLNTHQQADQHDWSVLMLDNDFSADEWL